MLKYDSEVPLDPYNHSPYGIGYSVHVARCIDLACCFSQTKGFMLCKYNAATCYQQKESYAPRAGNALRRPNVHQAMLDLGQN